MSWTESPLSFFFFLSQQSHQTDSESWWSFYLTAQLYLIVVYLLEILSSLGDSVAIFLVWPWPQSIPPQFLLSFFPSLSPPPFPPIFPYSLSFRIMALVPTIFWARDLFLGLNFALFKVNETIYGSKLCYCHRQTPRHCKLRIQSVPWTPRDTKKCRAADSVDEERKCEVEYCRFDVAKRGVMFQESYHVQVTGILKTQAGKT